MLKLIVHTCVCVSVSPPSPDNCKKMGLVFENVVGIVEVINCRDVKVQVREAWRPLMMGSRESKCSKSPPHTNLH